MAGHMTTNNEHLIRNDLWSRQIKELLLDDLMGTKYVRIITDFPDGEVIHIPSIGEAGTHDFQEGQAVKYERLDTGDFEFSFDQYKYSAHSISEKFKRDSYYAADVMSRFVPRQHRALMENVETRILSRGPVAQTNNDFNLIDGIPHRWVGNGTNESISVRDFSLANYSLNKAQVPQMGRVAIVDPSVAFTIENSTNLTNFISPHPAWGNVVTEGLVTGMRFKYNIFGFDVYTSNYLYDVGAQTIDTKTTTVGKANLFFSAYPGDTMPLIGGFRQMPTVHSEFNKDTQEEEFLTITEYGFKLYRPENMVVVITDTDVVDFSV